MNMFNELLGKDNHLIILYACVNLKVHFREMIKEGEVGGEVNLN
jgi:hypothetical protein